MATCRLGELEEAKAWMGVNDDSYVNNSELFQDKTS